jgi:dolichol kinase
VTGVLPQLAIVLAATLGILGVILGVGILGRRLSLPAEVQRKAVHVATGLFAIALPFLVTDRWPVACLIGLGIVVMGAMRVPALAGGFGSALHGVSRRSYGEILLALAVGFIFLRSRGNLILYALPISVITLSDTAAALAGTTYGRRLFTVERGTKSVEGVTVFFLVTWIVAMSMLLLFTDIPRANVFLLGVTVAAFGAIVEMDSWRGLDNLFVPVAVHFFLQGYLDAPEANLLGLSGLFLGTVLLVMLYSPYLRFLTPHAARAYCVAAFLLVGVSGALAAVLPILAVMAHVVARSVRPCRSQFPDLDLLATLAGAALIWLLIGETAGPSAIDFFKMSFLGIILVLAAIAARHRPVPVIAAGAALFLAYVPLVAFAPAYARWHGNVFPLAIANLALCAIACMARPAWFDRWRAPRTAALASLLPLSAYLWMVLP